MSHATISQFVRHLRLGPGPWADAGGADHELLERFAAGDEAAFAALVQRHGPLVLGLCRRLLGDPGMAEDVFQATFLVLARRAGSIRKRASVSSWLYGVARRLAHKARRGDSRRRQHERLAAQSRPSHGAPDAGWAELLVVLDEELARLPERARAPLLLCYLEGCTQDEAARFLGWSVGTLRRRLAWGRDLLRLRLTRRGATLSGGLFALLLAPQAATAVVPDSLLVQTARTAIAFAAGRVCETTAAALARAACFTLGSPMCKALALCLLTVGVVLVAAAGLAHRTEEGEPTDPNPPTPQAPDDKPGLAAAGRDRLGDPLPQGALVRFGTIRFRHPGGISGAALAPDGKAIAISGSHVLRLIDTATGRVRWSLPDADSAEGYTPGMRPLAFSPDGKALMLPAAQGVRLLDPATGGETRRVSSRYGMLRSIAFSPDGKEIALAIGGGAAFYEAATGKEQREILCAGCTASWLYYAPDGRSVALPGATASRIRLCDVATGKEIRSLENGSEVTAVAFAPAGQTLAAVGKDRVVRVWNIATGKEIHALPEGTAEPGRDALAVLAFSSDGKVLAAGTSDDSIALWDTASGKALRRLKGHTWMVTGLFFGPDGKTLFSTSWDATVRRWDIASGKEIRGRENEYDQGVLALSADGKRVATTGADGLITLWEAATGSKVRVLEGHRRGLFTLAFSPDGRRLASGGWEQRVRVWDVPAGKEERTLACGPGQDKDRRVEALAFSPDGRLLAGCDRHREVVRLWEADTGRELRQLAQSGAAALAFAPDGKTLAAGGWEGSLELWDVATGRKLRSIQPASGRAIFDAIAYSPDGRLIATGHHGNSVYLWEAATGKLVREIMAEQQVTWCLAFSPDGAWLATGGLDGTVRLWEVATARRMYELRGHDFWVLRLAFGPDGRTLATGGYDGTSLLWTLKPKIEPLPAGGLGPLWESLAEEDGARAYRAVWTLAEHPDETIPFLKKHMRSAKVQIDQASLRKWLADLDSDSFTRREAATRELARVGTAIEPNIRAALANTKSPEARRRLEQLLEDLGRQLSPEVLRRKRAVRVLELIGSREAMELLQTLAKEG
jgi:RNA polymerase sigma factor (sigma-70 family)